MDEKTLLEAIGQIIAPLAERQLHMQSVMENMDKKIDALFEGQANMNEKFAKLDQVAEDVDQIKEKVFALEEASKTQASQIRELRMVK